MPKSSTKELEEGRIRAEKWYEKNSSDLLRKRALARIKAGKLPNAATRTKYNITLEQIQCLRTEGGHNQVYTEQQVYEERSDIRQGQGGKATYIQCVPISQPAPAAIATCPVKDKGKGKAKAKVAPLPPAVASTSETAPKDNKVLGPMKADSGTVWNVANIVAAKKAYMPTGRYKKAGEMKLWAAAQLDKAYKNPRMLYSRFNIPADRDLIDEMKENWFSKHKPALTNAKIDNLGFFPGKTKAPTYNVAARKKAIVIMITEIGGHTGGLFTSDFLSRAPNVWNDLQGFSEKMTPIKDREEEDLSDKTTAKPWSGVLERLEKAHVPGPKAHPQKWIDYLLLVLIAGKEQVPIRNNYGDVKFVKKLADVPKQTDERDLTDYFAWKEKKFLFRSAKTRASMDGGQTISERVSNEVYKAIKNSYDAHPREYLLMKEDMKRPLGKVPTSKMKRIVGIGVNELRHSYITDWWFKTGRRNNSEMRRLATRMHTSVRLLLRYIRYGENVNDDGREIDFDKVDISKLDKDLSKVNVNALPSISRTKTI